MSGTKTIRRMIGVAVGKMSITNSTWIRMAGIIACITKRIDGGFMITMMLLGEDILTITLVKVKGEILTL